MDLATGSWEFHRDWHHPREYKYASSVIPKFQYQYRSWAALTLDQQHQQSWPWTLLLPCVLDRSNVSNPLHTPSDLYVLSTLLLSQEVPRRRTTACQRSRSSSKGIKVERVVHVTVLHLMTIGSLHRPPNLSSLLPFLPSIFPRPPQASCQHLFQHSILNPMLLIFVSFTTIPSTHQVGISMHSAAPSSPALHRMRHT